MKHYLITLIVLLCAVIILETVIIVQSNELVEFIHYHSEYAEVGHTH